MARPLRVNRAGIWFHVAARGIDRKNIFMDDSHRRHWLELFKWSWGRSQISNSGWRVHAYCLMSSHFHLILETPQGYAAMQIELGCESNPRNTARTLYDSVSKAFVPGAGGREIQIRPDRQPGPKCQIPDLPLTVFMVGRHAN